LMFVRSCVEPTANPSLLYPGLVNLVDYDTPPAKVLKRHTTPAPSIFLTRHLRLVDGVSRGLLDAPQAPEDPAFIPAEEDLEDAEADGAAHAAALARHVGLVRVARLVLKVPARGGVS
jgi:hypothetical protein